MLRPESGGQFGDRPIKIGSQPRSAAPFFFAVVTAKPKAAVVEQIQNVEALELVGTFRAVTAITTR